MLYNTPFRKGSHIAIRIRSKKWFDKIDEEAEESGIRFILKMILA
jgi:hypothetical protein